MNEIDTLDKIGDKDSAARETLISLLKLNINTLIPIAGPIINEYLFDLPGRIKQERFNRFIIVLGDMVAKIDSEKINHDYLHSDEFFDLTTKVFESSLKISTDTKRKALSSVYSSAIADDKKISHDQQIMFSDFITAMAPAHIHILNFISKNESQLIEIGTYEKYFAIFNEHYPDFTIDKYEFKYYTTDLELKSLISAGAGLENFDSTSSNISDHNHKEPSVKLSTIGHSFLQFLGD